MDNLSNMVFAGKPEDLADRSRAPMEDRIVGALRFALAYGQIDGDHHKAWVIDQIVRVLSDDAYFALIERWENNDEPNGGLACHGGWGGWTDGIAP